VKIREGAQLQVNKDEGTLHLTAIVKDNDNPNKKTTDFHQYGWAVTDKDGNTVTTIGSNSPVLKVDASLMSSASAPYTFTVNVSKTQGSRNITTSVSATSVAQITTDIIPRVVITQEGWDVLSADRMLVLTSNTTILGAACPECTYQWSLPQLTTAQLTAASTKGSAQRVLRLRAHTLTQGQMYTFTLTATYNGKSGSNSHVVEVNGPPNNGFIITEPQGNITHGVEVEKALAGLTDTTSPRTGVAFETEFMMQALNFSDKHTPLKYRFGYILKDSTMKNWISGDVYVATHATKNLGAGITMYPLVRAIDSYGAFMDAVSTYPIVISHPTVPAGTEATTHYKDKLATMLSAATGDPNVIAETIGAMATAINTLNPTTTEGKTSDRLMRDTMASHLKDSAASLSVSPQRILAIASSISTVAEPTQLTHEAQDMIQQSLNTALDRAESLEHSEGLLMLSVLNNLQSASKGTDRNSTGHQAEAAAHTKFLKLLAHKIATNLAAGEDAVVMEHGDVVQHAKKNNIEDAVGENIGGCAMNHADTSSLPAVVSHRVTVTKKRSIPHHYAPGNASVASDQFSCSMSDTDGGDVSLQSMDPPATVTIPANNVTSTAGHNCTFMNTATGRWESSGLSLQATNMSGGSGTFTCQSTHFTDFSMQLLPSDNAASSSSKDPPNLALVVCILLLVACCLAVWCFVVKKINEKRKVATKVAPSPEKDVNKDEPARVVFPINESGQGDVPSTNSATADADIARPDLNPLPVLPPIAEKYSADQES